MIRGVEALIAQAPNAFTTQFLESRIREEQRTKPPIHPSHHAAELIMHAGRDAFFEKDAQGNRYNTQIFPYHSGEGGSMSGRLNLAAMHFGISVEVLRELEHELEPQEDSYQFSMESFIAKFNSLARGTTLQATGGIRPMAPHAWDKIWLPNFQINRIRTIAKEDPTYAKFFLPEGIAAMPWTLLELLRETETLGLIQERIIPAYQELVGYMKDVTPAAAWGA